MRHGHRWVDWVPLQRRSSAIAFSSLRDGLRAAHDHRVERVAGEDDSREEWDLIRARSGICCPASGSELRGRAAPRKYGVESPPDPWLCWMS
jgi:hypothetical protein